MQNRPFRTPIVALFIHLTVTIIFICAPPAGEAFNFVVKLSSYPSTVLLTVTTIGLVKLRLGKDNHFYSPFSVPWPVIGFYLAGSLVSSVPFLFLLDLMFMHHFVDMGYIVPNHHAFCASIRK